MNETERDVLMKETLWRKITVTSSLSEMSTDPLGNRLVVGAMEGGGVTQPHGRMNYKDIEPYMSVFL
jgi:hypothetical protein